MRRSMVIRRRPCMIRSTPPPPPCPSRKVYLICAFLVFMEIFSITITFSFQLPGQAVMTDVFLLFVPQTCLLFLSRIDTVGWFTMHTACRISSNFARDCWTLEPCYVRYVSVENRQYDWRLEERSTTTKELFPNTLFELPFFCALLLCSSS